ncbi:TetR/AcrR family transcriptional regulator [Micromonospora sp. NPDC007230]|uniref:TetR/AcrR family transcriptional regulator n=1 Tax=Micromonospora sp. NPDC007230 TaxID=3364237 RepID=UPI00368DA772
MAQGETTPRKRGRPTAQERERRRDQILDAAVTLFVSKGYGQASIDELAASARVTKRTIYTYFGDKAEVFTAAIESFRAAALTDLTGRDESLAELGARLVFALHSDEAIGLHRLMIAEAVQFPGLAERFYTSGPRGYIELLATRVADVPGQLTRRARRSDLRPTAGRAPPPSPARAGPSAHPRPGSQTRRHGAPHPRNRRERRALT